MAVESGEQRAFELAKAALVSSGALVYYDLGLPVKITCDASPKG